jgi:hypothetical protein
MTWGLKLPSEDRVSHTKVLAGIERDMFWNMRAISQPAERQILDQIWDDVYERLVRR